MKTDAKDCQAVFLEGESVNGDLDDEILKEIKSKMWPIIAIFVPNLIIPNGHETGWKIRNSKQQFKEIIKF